MRTKRICAYCYNTFYPTTVLGVAVKEKYCPKCEEKLKNQEGSK